MTLERNLRPDDGKTLPCHPGTRRTEYTEAASGLRLRVTKDEARAWYVIFWSPTAKTARRLKLGEAATMPLADARKTARAALHAAENEGRDPHAERLAAREREREERKRRAEERQAQARDRDRRRVSFVSVCESYIKERATKPSGPRGRKLRPNTLANYRCTLSNHVEPALGDRAPEDITRAHLRRLMERAVDKGGSTVGLGVRNLVRAAWNWMDERPEDLGIRLPAASPLPGLALVSPAKSSRERCLTPAEVWKLWKATEEEGPVGLSLRFMLLTATRVRETTGLLWSELDLDAKVWKLPTARNKRGRDRAIPLSKEALAILRRIGRRAGPERVFADPRRLQDVLARVRAAMGGEPWQPRDLRRTAATLVRPVGQRPLRRELRAGTRGRRAHASRHRGLPEVGLRRQGPRGARPPGGLGGGDREPREGARGRRRASRGARDATEEEAGHAESHDAGPRPVSPCGCSWPVLSGGSPP